VIVVCATGTSAGRAAAQLRSQGFGEVSCWPVEASPPGARPACRCAAEGMPETMSQVLMYSTGMCPYCQRAEALLKARGVTEIEKIRVDLDPARRDEMIARTGRRTVPQIFIGDTHVGGFDDLSALDREGKLAPLLAL
jgi:glutaredoxin 3